MSRSAVKIRLFSNYQTEDSRVIDRVRSEPALFEPAATWFRIYFICISVSFYMRWAPAVNRTRTERSLT